MALGFKVAFLATADHEVRSLCGCTKLAHVPIMVSIGLSLYHTKYLTYLNLCFSEKVLQQLPHETFPGGHQAVHLQEMATNALVLLVTDVSALPELAEQWAKKTYAEASLQIVTDVQASGNHSSLILLRIFSR